LINRKKLKTKYFVVALIGGEKTGGRKDLKERAN